MPKLEKSTDRGHKLISSEDGQDTSACKISGQSLHAFSGKCPENSPDGQTDGRTCRKMVTVGRVGQRTHVQVKRGYFRLRTDGRTDGQPENIMPKGGGIITVRYRVAFRLWDPRPLLGSSTWSNSLITGNYAAASTRRHDLMFHPYRSKETLRLRHRLIIIFTYNCVNDYSFMP